MSTRISDLLVQMHGKPNRRKKNVEGNVDRELMKMVWMTGDRKEGIVGRMGRLTLIS